ncbi:MAG TPA: DUF1223 domain-containing protein, partial [Phenylobacterium sp.]
SGRAPRGGADVWLLRYDPREQEVEVKSGDNRGKTVNQRNVVREVTRLGAWRGKATAYRIRTPAEAGLKSVLLVQSIHDGRILGVAEKP